MYQAVSELPLPNRDTLAYLIVHLQTIADNSIFNKMDKDNLAVIMGPTILGKFPKNSWKFWRFFFTKLFKILIWHFLRFSKKLKTKLISIWRIFLTKKFQNTDFAVFEIFSKSVNNSWKYVYILAYDKIIQNSDILIFSKKFKNSWKCVYILSKQCRSSFNLTEKIRNSIFAQIWSYQN